MWSKSRGLLITSNIFPKKLCDKFETMGSPCGAQHPPQKESEGVQLTASNVKQTLDCRYWLAWSNRPLIPDVPNSASVPWFIFTFLFVSFINEERRDRYFLWVFVCVYYVGYQEEGPVSSCCSCLCWVKGCVTLRLKDHSQIHISVQAGTNRPIQVTLLLLLCFK